MKVFSAADYPQGSPQWHELRRGIPTASAASRILTPKTCKPSAQAGGLMDDLIMDLVNPSPNWFTERGGKPPNRAIEEGVAREAESRRWYEMTHDIECTEVGFCLSDCGRYGCSPDMLIGAEGVGELKNPLLSTQSRYLREGGLLEDYKTQVHFQLIVTGLQYVDLISYAPPLPPLVIRVEPGKFTEALKEALDAFLDQFAALKKSLGLPDLHPVAGEIVSPVAVRQDEESYPF